MVYINLLRRILKAWPGEKYFAEYRFLPFFFLSGAALEYFMIHWHAGEINFYNTYKRKQVEKLADQREKASLLNSNLIRIKRPN